MSPDTLKTAISNYQNQPSSLYNIIQLDIWTIVHSKKRKKKTQFLFYPNVFRVFKNKYIYFF